jgi:hypothetical protein
MTDKDENHAPVALKDTKQSGMKLMKYSKKPNAKGPRTPFDAAITRSDVDKIASRQYATKLKKGQAKWNGQDEDFEWDVDDVNEIDLESLLSSPWLKNMLYAKDAFTVSCMFPGEVVVPYVTHRSLPYPTAIIRATQSWTSGANISGSPVCAPYTVIFYSPTLGSIPINVGLSTTAGSGIVIGDYNDSSSTSIIGTLGDWAAQTTNSMNYRDNPFTSSTNTSGTLWRALNLATPFTNFYGSSPIGFNQWIFPWSSQIDITLEAAAATAAGSVYTGSLSLAEAYGSGSGVSFSTLLARAERVPVQAGGTYSIKQVVVDASCINNVNAIAQATSTTPISGQPWLERVSYIIIKKPFASITGGNPPSFTTTIEHRMNYAYQPLVANIWNESRTTPDHGYKSPPNSNPDASNFKHDYTYYNGHVAPTQETKQSFLDTVSEWMSWIDTAIDAGEKYLPVVKGIWDAAIPYLSPYPSDMTPQEFAEAAHLTLNRQGSKVRAATAKATTRRVTSKYKKLTRKYTAAKRELGRYRETQEPLPLAQYAAASGRRFQLQDANAIQALQAIEEPMLGFLQKLVSETKAGSIPMSPTLKRVATEHMADAFGRLLHHFTASIVYRPPPYSYVTSPATQLFRWETKPSYAPGTMKTQISSMERAYLEIDQYEIPEAGALLLANLANAILSVATWLEDPQEDTKSVMSIQTNPRRY